jgi:peroxiredoxin
MTSNKCTFTSLVAGESDVSRKYEIRYVPTNFIINKSGIVKHMSVGGREAEKWDSAVEKLLSQ